MAVNGHVVAGAQLEGGGLINVQVWFLNLGESAGAVVGQPADIVAGIVVVIAVASK